MSNEGSVIDTIQQLPLAHANESPQHDDGGLFYMPPATDAERRNHRQRPYRALGFKAFQGDVIDGCLGLETPSDPETGLPLPILPIEPLLYYAS